MSLSKKVVLTVSGYKISLSDSLQFYQNDQLKLIFEINKYGIDVASSFTHKTLMPLQPLTATLFIETPLGVDSIESANIEDNAVTFYLTSNQTQHVGTSSMQIKLTDDDGCQITLPSFTFEVQENIYDGAVQVSGILLADENGNTVSDENGNTVNATATTETSKQIKDFTLKTGVSGQEDILVQDNGVTKRIKSNELIDTVDLSGYATKTDLNNKANVSHTHTKSDITDLSIPTKTSQLTNDTGMLTSNSITRIEVVNVLPEQQENGVLYIVKGDYSQTCLDGVKIWEKSSDIGGSGSDSDSDSGSTDTDTYLPLEDSNVRNLVPYLSTYYIKPTVAPNEEIILNYFVTDYYGRSYTNNSSFYNYKIIVRRDGKPDIVTKNVSAGDHSVSLGSYSSEGTYHFSIVAVDQYGRCSHELFNYVRVQNSKIQNSYTITSSDLSSYGIVIDNDKEEREYVTVSSANFEKIESDTQKATVQSAIDNAYNDGSVSSGKYKVFIPMFGASSGTDYKGKTNGWKCLKVKYDSGFDAATFLNQCATNRQNLQRLISEKANAGYNKIVLRQGTYMIDNTPIDIPNGITLDLNGSTIKMCPITGSGALMMRMTDCTDTHLCNGTIEGDYFAHDYANSPSNSEWVSGVEMAGSCRYCSIRDLTIKNITGYGLQNSISSTSPNGNTFYGAIKVADLEQGDIDRETGQNISCAYRLRSGVSNISAYQGKSEFISMSIHLNYQGNEFSSWNYYMYFYDSGNNFIQAVSAYQYRQVKIPQNAYYVRIVILGERLKSDWNLHYQFFRVPTHCEFRNVTVDNARCVGMAQGQMKDFLVQDCIITNSGQSSATCSYDAEDGWDGMQDVFFENFRIYDCPNNGFLTCAGHNFVINNMNSEAIYMWERMRWAVIKNSTFTNGCVIRGGGEANIVQHGVTRFYDNTVLAPDYVNYLFMNVAKNCTYTTAPKNGIMVDSSVNGNTVSRTVYNNDTNNQITDDIGKSTDNVDYDDTGSQDVPVSKVTLNKTSISLTLNATEQLVATVFPTNASNQGVTWSSSATNVASVSSSGLVTGKGSGSAIITVRTDDGGYTATCSVQVTSSSSGGTVASLNPVSCAIKVGDSQTFTLVNTSATISSCYVVTGKGTISNYNSTSIIVQAISEGTEYLNVVLSDDTSLSATITISANTTGGGNTGGDGGGSTSSGISNSSDTALTQQYSSSHEATPNIANPPSGAYNWKYAPRINPDGSFPNSAWNAFGHWMTTYKIEKASYYDNVGLLLQNPKAWIWNTSTKSWDVLSSDFEWGSWYLEDFYDDGNSTIANSVTWEKGASGNHSTWVKIKQDSTTQGRCFHPWGYQKDWRSNSSWSNNGQPYIVTKVDFKLVKYDENGVDNLDSAQLVVNSGGDWWSEVGATWKPDWSTNRDMCVGKYIKATRELKRAWATNLPSSWSYGLPMDDNSSGGGSGSGELDSDGYVIVKYPASQKAKPTAWCALGDSITAGVGAGGSSYSYANVCANQQGISVINNYGIAGTCVSAGFNTALTELGVETAFCNRFGEMSDGADLITVFGSVNDHGTDVKIGSPTSTDKNDFYGALYVLINGLKEKYPNGRIVFITPFKVNGWDGTNMYKHTLKDFRNAIVTQCNRFQIEVVDLFLQSQFDWSTGLDKGWFVSYDYYHPTAAGQQAIATYIGSVMFEENSGGSGGSGGEITPNTFDFSQENAVEYGGYGDYRTPPISRAGYSKVTITTEVAGYIGIITFSNETTIIGSHDDNYRAEGTFSITIPTDACTYVAVKFSPSMIGHISAKLEV